MAQRIYHGKWWAPNSIVPALYIKYIIYTCSYRHATTSNRKWSGIRLDFDLGWHLQLDSYLATDATTKTSPLDGSGVYLLSIYRVNKGCAGKIRKKKKVYSIQPHHHALLHHITVALTVAFIIVNRTDSTEFYRVGQVPRARVTDWIAWRWNFCLHHGTCFNLYRMDI